MMITGATRDAVRALLLANVAEGHSRLLGEHYCYIQPSPSNYPFQFWWDTCFHVAILCRLGEYELAKRNLRSLFAMQEENGFVGHMIFWNKLVPTKKSDVLQARPRLPTLRPYQSSLIQPPLVACALKRIWDGTHDRAFLGFMMPKLKRYFHWLAANRDFDGSGLVSIISPFESGLDWKPAYDPVLGFRPGPADWRLYWKVWYGVDGRNFLRRYDLAKIRRAGVFVVKDVLVNSLYAYDLGALAGLCDAAGDAQAETFRDRARRAANAILNTMYDEQRCAFFDLYGADDRMSKVLTFTALLPIILAEVPKELAVEMARRHLGNADEFATPFPVPSVAKNEPSFDPHESKYLWRGPTWVVANWLLHTCAVRKDLPELADRLATTVADLIRKSGFREYYDPFTGAGYGAPDFTWSGLVLDME